MKWFAENRVGSGIRVRPWARPLSVTLGLLALLGSCPHPAFAADRTWTGATSADWNTNGNWTGGTPSSGDNALFNGTFTNQPTLNNNKSAGGIWMTGSIGQNVTISDSGGNTLTLNGNTINGTAGLGILVDNANAFALTINAPIKIGGAQTWRNNSGNLLTIGGAVNLNNKAFTIDGTGNTTISGVMSGAGAFTKSGSGNVILSSNANTYTGTTTVNGGNLSIGTFTIGLSGAATIAAGATLTSTGVLNLTPDTTAAQTFISGAGTLLLRNPSSSAGAPDIYYDPTGGTGFGWGVTIASNLDVGTGSRFFNGQSNRNDFERYGGDLIFSGNLNGSANLTFTGTPNTGGTNPSYQMAYTLNGNNSSFIGGITLTGGANLILNSSNALTSANSVTFTPGTGAVAGLYLYGTSVTIGALSGTSAGTMNIRNGSLVTDSNSPINPGIVSSNAVLTVQQNTNTTFNGIISNGLNDHGAGDAGTYYTLGLSKTGTGTLTLGGTNTYTGVTTINAGTLSVGTIGNGGVAGNLGSASNAATNLVLNGGTLQYTGAAASTDRLFTLGTGGGTLDSSGSGTATFSNTGSMGLTGSGARTLTLTGSNNGSLAAVIGDNGGATALTKTGGGTWTLTGANTFTGNTTVSAGTLAVNADNALGATAKVTINTGGTVLLGTTAGNNRIGNTTEVALAGGTFNTGGFSETVGKMTLSGNSTLDFGAGTSHLTFDGASSLGSSTLTVLNWTGVPVTAGGTDQLLFKNSSFTAGSTTSQVQFNIGGTLYNSIFLNAGSSMLELVPVPEPSTIFGASIFVIAVGWRERRRLARLFRKA